MQVQEYLRNREQHSAAELASLEGEWIAWSEDGKRIVAHAAELTEIFVELDRNKINEYVLEFQPPSDEVFWGGAGS